MVEEPGGVSERRQDSRGFIQQNLTNDERFSVVSSSLLLKTAYTSLPMYYMKEPQDRVINLVQ
jgi:hypothetical protein